MEKIPGCTLGAVVRGLPSLNDGPLSPDIWRTIDAAFLEYGLLVFPGQHDLTKEAQVGFGRHFGELEFETNNFTNQRKSGALLKEDEFAWKGSRVADAWHRDSTYLPVAAKAGLLYAEVVPKTGGETEWADMGAGYDCLDEETKAKIENLTAYHSTQYSVARRAGVFDGIFGDDDARPGRKKENTEVQSNEAKEQHGQTIGMVPRNHNNAIKRPLVHTHPETKRKTLLVAVHSFGIPGMPRDESSKLLDDLVEKACQGPRVYRHNWQVGDLVLWDQRAVNHRAMPFDNLNEPRKLRGTRVAGDLASEGGLPAPEGPEVLAAEMAQLKLHPEKDLQRLR